MQPVITAEQARRIDQLTSENYKQSFLLMQSAAEACFKVIWEQYGGKLDGRKAKILCGPGNNGGDGAALAAQLAQAAMQVDVVLFAQVGKTKGDAQTNFENVRRLANENRLSFRECESLESWQKLAPALNNYDVVVDGLFGLGLSRPLEGIFAEIVKGLNKVRGTVKTSRRPLVLSIDLPSGLNADLANPIGETVQADLTVTFTAPKPANVLPPASHCNGKLIVSDIGSPESLLKDAEPNLFIIQESDARAWLIRTRYTPESFKNSHGHVLVIAGSRGYTGAAVLSGSAAMRSGAGLVTIATPASAQTAIATSGMPEVMTIALAETDRGAVSDAAIEHALKLSGKSEVVAIGPGLSSEDERTRQFVFQLVKQRTTPMVIDADGLNCLAPWPDGLKGSSSLPLVVTPHAGEMKRLLGTTAATALDDRVAVARDFATRNHLILVLKGSRSIIAAPDGRVFINPTGNAGLGTAGAGDTLTGLIAGFIAQGPKPNDTLSATFTALYVGGLAGDLAAQGLGMRTMVASDIRNHFSEAIRRIDLEGELP